MASSQTINPKDVQVDIPASEVKVDQDPWEANKSTFFKEHPLLGEVFKATAIPAAPELGAEGLASKLPPGAIGKLAGKAGKYLFRKVPIIGKPGVALYEAGQAALKSPEAEDVFAKTRGLRKQQALRSGGPPETTASSTPGTRIPRGRPEPIPEPEPAPVKPPFKFTPSKSTAAKMKFGGPPETQAGATAGTRLVRKGPSPLKSAATASESTTAQPVSETKLLDDIAKGQAGKKFEHLDPKQQEAVRKIAEDIQNRGAGEATLAKPPARTPKVETIKPNRPSGPAPVGATSHADVAKEFVRQGISPEDAAKTLKSGGVPAPSITEILSEMNTLLSKNIRRR